MDAPTTPLGWLNAAGLVWQFVAYMGAALGLIGTLGAVTMPRPFCTIAAATRCLLRLQPRGEQVEAVDMVRLGAVMIAGSCLAMAGNTTLYLFSAGWDGLGRSRSLLWIGAHVGLWYFVGSICGGVGAGLIAIIAVTVMAFTPGLVVWAEGKEVGEVMDGLARRFVRGRRGGGDA